jgi:hypothetical protein
MVELTQRERVTLRDVLDIQLEQFEAAMHEDNEQGERPRTLEELLSHSGSYGDILQDLRSIRRKINE